MTIKKAVNKEKKIFTKCFLNMAIIYHLSSNIYTLLIVGTNINNNKNYTIL